MGAFLRMMNCIVSISITTQPGFAQAQTTADELFLAYMDAEAPFLPLRH